MGFIRRAFEFVARPSHSRTLGLVLMLVLVAAVSLTVYVAQQQQETRQRASGSDKIITYSPERRNPDPDLANVAGNFGCKEGYHVISPEICCPSGTIYCNLPKDNPINLCADNIDACNALIEEREIALAQPTPTSTPTPGAESTPNTCADLPDCGSGLTCFASSSCSGTCSPNQYKCLSGTDFNMSKSYNRKSVVCCNVPPTPTPKPAQIVTASLCNPTCKDNETCTFYDDPGGLTGYSCSPNPTPTPSLSVTLSANPSSGTAPLNGVTLTAQVSGDTRTRTYRYIFSCSGTLTAFNSTDTDATTATLTNICNFPQAGTHTAGVQVNIISGPYNLPLTNSITITVNDPPTPTPICGLLGGPCCSTTSEECSQGTFCSGNTCINATVKTPTPTPILCGIEKCNFSTQFCFTDSDGTQFCKDKSTLCLLKTSGDANCDGKINITDFNIWRDEFKKYLTSSTADFNKDGRITIVDFNILRDGLKNTSLPHQ